jgi:hypothetical protein
MNEGVKRGMRNLHRPILGLLATVLLACLSCSEALFSRVEAQAAVSVERIWFETRDGDNKSLAVLAILINESPEVVEVQSVTVDVFRDDDQITTWTGDCMLKEILDVGERSSCYVELDISALQEEVTEVRVSAESGEATRDDLARFAQDPVIERAILRHGEDVSVVDFILGNPGPAAYRSDGGFLRGAVHANVIFLREDKIVGVHAFPNFLADGHLPVGLRFPISAYAYREADLQPDAYEIFFAMRPLPSDRAPIQWEVDQVEWHIEGEAPDRSAVFSAMIRNGSRVDAGAAASVTFFDAEGGRFLTAKFPPDRISAGADFAFVDSLSWLWEEEPEEMMFLITSLETEAVDLTPEPTAVVATPTATPSPEPTESPTPTPEFRLYMPLLDR